MTMIGGVALANEGSKCQESLQSALLTESLENIMEDLVHLLVKNSSTQRDRIDTHEHEGSATHFWSTVNVNEILKEKQRYLNKVLGRKKTRDFFIEMQRRVNQALESLSEVPSLVNTRKLLPSTSHLSVFNPKALFQLDAPINTGFRSSTFLEEGKKILVTTSDGYLRIFDVKHQDLIDSIKVGGPGRHFFVVVSPDEKHFLSVHGNMVKVWDLQSKREVATFSEHTSPVIELVFSNDGQQVLSASKGKLTHRGLSPESFLWPVTNTQRFRAFPISGRSSGSIEFSADDKKLLLAGSNRSPNAPTLFDLATNEFLPLKSQHQAVLTSATYSPDGQSILSSSFDGSASILNTTGNGIISGVLKNNLAIKGAIYSLDGQHVFTLSDGSIKIWKTSDETLVTTLDLKDAGFEQPTFRAIKLSSDGRLLLYIDDKKIKTWKIYQELEMENP